MADCLYLANVDGEAPWVDAALKRLLVGTYSRRRRVCRVLSVGGGPAFDLVAMAILCDVVSADYYDAYAAQNTVQEPRHGTTTTTTATTTTTTTTTVQAATANDDDECSEDPAVRVEATVLDYEAGWEKCAVAVANALRECTCSSGSPKKNALPQTLTSSCKAGHHSMLNFGRCDINEPLTSEVNSAAAQVVYERAAGEVPDTAGGPGNPKGTRQPRHPIVVVASYVVAENAEGLRRTNFCFFRDLMREAAPGSLFVFTETTHRLWPELLRVAFEEFFLFADKDPRCNRSQDMSPCDLTHVPTRETFLVAFPWRIQHGSALLLGKPFFATTETARLDESEDARARLQPRPTKDVADGGIGAVPGAVSSSSALRTNAKHLQPEPIEDGHDWIDDMIESLLSEKDRRKLHQFRMHKERHRSKAQLLAKQRAASSASAALPTRATGDTTR